MVIQLYFKAPFLSSHNTEAPTYAQCSLVRSGLSFKFLFEFSFKYKRYSGFRSRIDFITILGLKRFVIGYIWCKASRTACIFLSATLDRKNEWIHVFTCLTGGDCWALMKWGWIWWWWCSQISYYAVVCFLNLFVCIFFWPDLSIRQI